MSDINRINVTVSTGLGTLRIYSDPKQTKQALRLIKDVPTLMYSAYVDAAQRFGSLVVKRARECIDRDQPPKGTSWPPLSKEYVKRYHPNGHYFLNGLYYEAIGIYVDKVAFAGTGKFAGYQVHIGLPTSGSKQYHTNYVKTKTSRGNLTMLQLGNLLEFGFQAFGKAQVPPRPLWIPIYAEFGGKNRLRVYLSNAIKRQVENYIAHGCHLQISNTKNTAASLASEKSGYITFNK